MSRMVKAKKACFVAVINLDGLPHDAQCFKTNRGAEAYIKKQLGKTLGQIEAADGDWGEGDYSGTQVVRGRCE